MLLKKVRLSFPALFTPTAFQGEGEKKFEATFLVEKGSANHKMLEAEIEKLLTDDLKGIKLPSDKICLKDGDEKAYDGYEGHMFIKAASKKRVSVVDQDKTPLTEDDEKIYGGCYVNAIIDLWAQNNQYGKRINAGLRGVQFDSHGDSFSGSSAARDDEFVDYEPEF